MIGHPRTKPNKLASSALCALVAGCATVTRPASPPASYPSDATVQDLVIDALHPSASPSPQYSQNARVRIVVANVNPYLFKYRIVASDATWAEVSPAEFFTAILNGGLPTVSAGEGVVKEGPAHELKFDYFTERGRIVPPQGCAVQEEPFVNEYKQLLDSLLTQDRELNDTVGKVRTEIGKYEQQGKAQLEIMHDITQPTATVREAAEQNRILLSRTLAAVRPALDILPTSVTAFGQRVAKLDPLVATAREKFPNCVAFVDLTGHLLAMGRDTLVLRANANTLTHWRDTAETSLAFMNAVNPDPLRFSLIRVLNAYRSPTDVTIRVQRKAPSSDTTDFASIVQRTLNFGGLPRFSIGAGVAWTSLATEEYEARKIYSPSFQGRTDTVITAVALKESAHNRVSPMLTLSTRLLGFNSTYADGVHATLGATLRKDGSSTAPEFLIGLGLSGLGQRIMVTGGEYFGRTQALVDGVSVGTRLPGGSVPVDTRIIWEPAVMVSFKIK